MDGGGPPVASFYWNPCDFLGTYLFSYPSYKSFLIFLFFFRHEKVQENCIDLVGRIADRGAEHVGAREWMRICFELLELLKAHKKAIRRATVNTFGYIAKAIGWVSVLVVFCVCWRKKKHFLTFKGTVTALWLYYTHGRRRCRGRCHYLSHHQQTSNILRFKRHQVNIAWTLKHIAWTLKQ